MREVSNALCARPNDEAAIDPHGHSVLFAVFGQFLSHDITLRSKEARPRFVQVGDTDSMFPPGTLLPYEASELAPGAYRANNLVTAWIDASMVYGSDVDRADALRSFSAGRLRTSADDQLPRYGLDEVFRVCAVPRPTAPMCTPPFANENPRREPESSLFFAGDVRANENPVLLSLHTIFLREHNRYAAELAKRHPRWTDERLYQEARRWVGAIVQAITYYEYLPRLLGRDAVGEYTGYQPSRAEPLSWVFSAVAFRFGHSQLGPMLFRNNSDGREFEFSDVSLKAAFFATPLYEQAGPGPWLAGATASVAERVDLWVVDDLRNYMFGNLHGGLDLATINIAVGREALAGRFNDIRAKLGLTRHRSFEDLTDDPEVAHRLKALYRRVDDVDPWMAMLAEPAPRPRREGIVGETLKAALTRSFRALRDGDRFYFENDPALSDEVDVLRRMRLVDVIRRNLRGEWRDGVFAEEAFDAPSFQNGQGALLHATRSRTY